MYAKATLRALSSRERWVRGGAAAVIAALSAALASSAGAAASLLIGIAALATLLLAVTALVGDDLRVELGPGRAPVAAAAGLVL